MSISQSASPTAESETCAICSTVPDAADRRMVCAQCVDAFFAGSGPVSESAEELARRLGERFNGRFAETFEGAIKIATVLIAAHDAETLRKAAEMVRLSPKRFPHYYHETDEMNTADEAILVEDAVAAILGEGKA